MTIKYHDPKRHPRCETCLLSDTPRVDAITCHLSSAYSPDELIRNVDWFCEKGLWMVDFEHDDPTQNLPDLERAYLGSNPFSFEEMIRLHEAATRVGE